MAWDKKCYWRWWLQGCLWILTTTTVTASDTPTGSCQLPDSWRGTWFQSGFPQPITIDHTSLDVKGHCVESDGERFIFEDRDENCFRCLFIVQRHHNVLQYKESYCERWDTLENLCQLIPVDSQQYTMFRKEASAVECPLRGAFTFTYSRGHGECRAPVSRLDSCTESSRLLFRYQACPDVQGTESSEEQLECLATWKEGSTRYMVGRLEHQGATSDEDRYRCFVYERTATSRTGEGGSAAAGGGALGGIGGTGGGQQPRPTVLLAQSGDATCTGLVAANEGSRTLRLTKVEVDSRRCRFPAWLAAHSHWQTLDGRWSYNLHKNTTLRISNATVLGGSASSAGPGVLLHHNSPPSSVSSSGTGHGIQGEQRATCHSVIDLGEKTARVVAHMAQGCHTGYVCMVFYLRDGHVVEFQSGEMSPAAEEACSTFYFNPQPGHYTTLISASHQSVACPVEGKFVVPGARVPFGYYRDNRPCGPNAASTAAASAASSETTATTAHSADVSLVLGAGQGSLVSLTAGCTSQDTLELHSECSRSEPATAYMCRSSWTDDTHEGTQYLIATPLNRPSRSPVPRRLCFTIHKLAPNSGSHAAGSTPSLLRHHTTHSYSAHSATPHLLQFTASAESCLRPNAAPVSHHLPHYNAHNHVLQSWAWSGGTSHAHTTATFNVTHSGPCTGMEAAVLDSRAGTSSDNNAAPLGASRYGSLWTTLVCLLFACALTRR